MKLAVAKFKKSDQEAAVKLKSREAVSRFLLPNQSVSEIDQSYLMRHENEDQIEVHLFDDLMGSIRVGRIGQN
jgi:uncharacterized protein (UPF0261 family)